MSIVGNTIADLSRENTACQIEPFGEFGKCGCLFET